MKEKVHLVPNPATGDAELRAEAEVADDVKKPSEDLLLLLRELHGLLHHDAPRLLLRQTRRHAGVPGEGAHGGEEEVSGGLVRGDSLEKRRERRRAAAEKRGQEAAARKEAARHVAVSLPLFTPSPYSSRCPRQIAEQTPRATSLSTHGKSVNRGLPDARP